MKINATTLTAFAQALLSIAGTFDPKSAKAIKDVIEAGTEFNDMIQKIKTQTEENAPEVWDEVAGDYNDSLDAFKASVARHN